jgi:hypothetical protein
VDPKIKLIQNMLYVIPEDRQFSKSANIISGFVSVRRYLNQAGRQQSFLAFTSHMIG